MPPKALGEVLDAAGAVEAEVAGRTREIAATGAGNMMSAFGGLIAIATIALRVGSCNTFGLTATLCNTSGEE